MGCYLMFFNCPKTRRSAIFLSDRIDCKNDDMESVDDDSNKASMNDRGRSVSSIRSKAVIVLLLGSCVVMPSRAFAQSFDDVPIDYWAFSFVETLAQNRITAGCGGNNYCPENSVTRAQMAVFLERGINGSDFSPPPASGSVFLDVAATDFAASFIEQLFFDGITAGCGNNNYCPNDQVTRAQMAVFLLRAVYGAGYSPPAANGIFDDVPLDYWAVRWIEQLAAEGITGGCGGGNYCPDNRVTRAQMAVFLVRAFNLIASDLRLTEVTVPPPAVLQIGHPATISMLVESERDERNVAVQVFLLDQLQYGDGTPCLDVNNNPIPCPDGSDGDDGKRLLVGSASFETVLGGSNNYTAEILIPYTVPETGGSFCHLPSGAITNRSCNSDLDCNVDESESCEPGILFRPFSAGDYYLYAEVDPAGVIYESSEDNNSPMGPSFPAGAAVVEVRDDEAGTPNVVLESVVVEIPDLGIAFRTLDLPCIEVDMPFPLPDLTCPPSGSTPANFCGRADPQDVIPDVENALVGITAVVNASGSFGALTPAGAPSAIPEVRVLATVDHPSLSSPLGLDFWDPLLQQYMPALSVSDVEPGVSTSVHLDLRLDSTKTDQFLAALSTVVASCLLNNLPPTLGKFLACLGEASLEVTVSAYDASGVLIEEFEPAGVGVDNEITVDVVVRADPPEVLAPQPSFGFETSFAEGFYGDLVSVGIAGSAEAGADGGGAFANVDVGLPISLFGSDFTFLSLAGTGRALPQDSNSSFGVSLDFLGTTVLAGSTADDPACPVTGVREWKVGGPECPTPAGNDCFAKPTQQEVNQCLRDCWAFGDGTSVERDFPVGGVPVTASFFTAGTAGFEVSAGAPCGQDTTTEFTASAGPWADLSMDVSAGVGSSQAFAVGAGGSATLINDTLFARAQFDLALTGSSLNTTLRHDITNKLTGPNGKLYLYAVYPCIKFCSAWGIPYPCFKLCKSTQDVAKFQTFSKEDVLFCEEESGTVVIQ